MKITNKEREILEELFNISEGTNEIELESWTDGVGDMFITIDKNSYNTLLEQLKEFVENFDIDEEIEIYRQDTDYRRNFTIRESINDFENWVDYIRNCIRKLEEEYNNEDEEELEEYNDEDEEEMDYEPLETLKGVGVKDTENGIEIMLMGMISGLLQKYEVIMNIKNYDETDLFNICYEISNEVKNLYYNNNGVPSETQVKEVIRNIIVK